MQYFPCLCLCWLKKFFSSETCKAEKFSVIIGSSLSTFLPWPPLKYSVNIHLACCQHSCIHPVACCIHLAAPNFKLILLPSPYLPFSPPLMRSSHSSLSYQEDSVNSCAKDFSNSHQNSLSSHLAIFSSQQNSVSRVERALTLLWCCCCQVTRQNWADSAIRAPELQYQAQA